jgi:hypothetical protein
MNKTTQESAAMVLADLLSGDSDRIWSASHAIIQSRDAAFLGELSGHGEAIQQATDGIAMGGAFRSNRDALAFSIAKLRHVAAGSNCLCELYPDCNYNGIDPKSEAEAGYVEITKEVVIPYESEYDCRCTHCDATYFVKEGDYHLPYWNWTRR